VSYGTNAKVKPLNSTPESGARQSETGMLNNNPALFFIQNHSILKILDRKLFTMCNFDPEKKHNNEYS
jgi:hypothetical protein